MTAVVYILEICSALVEYFFVKMENFTQNITDISIIAALHAAIIEKDTTRFLALTREHNVVFTGDVFLRALEAKALWIFLSVLREFLTKDQLAALALCRANTPSIRDVSGCGKRSVTKSVTKHFDVARVSPVPQAVFMAAEKRLSDDREILRFVVACGIPVDIETYAHATKSKLGWASSLASLMAKQCQENWRVAEAIATARQ